MRLIPFAVKGFLGDAINEHYCRLTLLQQSQSHALAQNFVLLDNFYDAGDVSGDGWNWDTQGHANDVTVKNILVGYGNSNFNIPFDWNGNPRNIGIAVPDETSGTPSPSTVRITTLIDPTGNSSVEPGTKDVTASQGADDLDPDALGGYIWDTILRAGKTVRHYGPYADENYYVVPSAGPPLYIPIVRDAFAQKVVQAVPGRPSLVEHTDLYYRGWDLNTPDQYRFEEWNREFNEYVKNGNLISRWSTSWKTISAISRQMQRIWKILLRRWQVMTTQWVNWSKRYRIPRIGGILRSS